MSWHSAFTYWHHSQQVSESTVFEYVFVEYVIYYVRQSLSSIFVTSCCVCCLRLETNREGMGGLGLASHMLVMSSGGGVCTDCSDSPSVQIQTFKVSF